MPDWKKRALVSGAAAGSLLASSAIASEAGTPQAQDPSERNEASVKGFVLASYLLVFTVVIAVAVRWMKQAGGIQKQLTTGSGPSHDTQG